MLAHYPRIFFNFSALLVAFATALPWTPASANYGDGGTVGNGGRTIVDPEGKPLEPADLHYQATDFVLPSHYGPRISLKDRPALARELNEILEFIARRAGVSVHKFFPTPLEDYEIYPTEQLSGSDPLPIEEGFHSEASAFTYSDTSFDEQGQRRHRRIVELRPSIFDPLETRHQALQLVHEMLHADATFGHEVIAPFIKDLNVLLRVRDRQLEEQKARGGKITDISEDEYRTSRAFQGFIELYVRNPDLVSIDRRGGGVIQAKPGSFSPSNYVSVGSMVIYQPVKDPLLLCGHRQPDPVLNQFIDAHLELDRGCDPCAYNLFQNVSGSNLLVICEAQHNRLIDVHAANGGSGAVILSGKAHELTQVSLHGKIRLWGENSVLENVRVLEKNQTPGELNVNPGIRLKNLVVRGMLRINYTIFPLFKRGAKSATLVGAVKDGEPQLTILGNEDGLDAYFKSSNFDVRRHHSPFDFSPWGEVTLKIPSTSKMIPYKLRDTAAFVEKFRVANGSQE